LRRKAKAQKRQWILPYLRYLAVLPEVERQKILEAKRLEDDLRRRRLCPGEANDPDVQVSGLYISTVSDLISILVLPLG